MKPRETDPKTDSWWKWSLVWAIGVAVLASIMLPTPIHQWKLFTAVALLAFLVFCWWNPKLRYWRLALQILTMWGVSQFGSKLMLYLGVEQGTLAFAFENDASSMFDVSMAACVVTALVLDFCSRSGSPLERGIRQLISVTVTRQEIRTNLGTQTNIGHAAVVNINQSIPAPSEGELDDALTKSPATTSPAVREGAYHDQIDIAVGYMKEDKVDVAIEFLLRLRKREWDRMSERAKYRTLANLGHCRGRREEYAQSLSDFREALKHQPGDLDGRCFVAAAEYSAGNDKKARQLAEEILEEHPDAIYSHVVMLKTASSGYSVESLWNELPEVVKNAPPVLAAAGWRAASQKEFTFAKTLAQKGKEDVESKSEFEVLDAAICIGKLSLRIMGNPPASEEEVAILNDAIARLESTEACVEVSSAKQQVGQVYYYLACAYRLIGKNNEAEHAYRQAVKAWPSATDVGRQYVLLLNELGRLDDAVGVLHNNEYHQRDVESTVLLAHCLAERDKSSDKTRAKDLLKSALGGLGDCDLATISNAVNLLGLLEGESENVDETIETITNLVNVAVSEAHSTALCANARLCAGEEEAAKQLCVHAVAILGDTEEIICLWDVAEACKATGLFDSALSVYERFVTSSSPKRHVMALLECADRSSDNKTLLEFCKALRSHGVVFEEAIELEAVTREKYDDLEGAIEVLDAYLALQREDYFSKLVNLRRAVLGIRYGREELWNVNPSDLPSSDDADGSIGRLVVIVLKKQGRDETAIEYAYALLRRRFNDSEAHQAFVASVGPPGSEVKLPCVTEAGPGCAVQYQSLIGSESGWWILEDLPDARQELRELELSHPVARDLIGKGANDEFTLRSSSIQDVTARIVKIISKYQYRYGDIFDRWQDRFPGEFFVWKVEMQKDESGELDLSPIFKSLDDKAKHTEQLHQVYREHPMSVASFSVVSGVDAIDAATHLATESDLKIRCCFGNEQEYQSAVACTGIASDVVLCPSALATLWLLRAWELVDEFPFLLVVPRGVMEQLRRKQEGESLHGQGFLSKIGEKYVLTETNEEQRIQFREDLNAFYEWLVSLATIVSGLPLAEIPVEMRDNLSQIFGVDTAQSIAVAKQRDIPLWTDDLGVGELGRIELEVSRTWTEVVLGSLVANGKLDNGVYDDMVAILNGCGYCHSRLTPQAILAAAKKAEWNPQSWPFPAVVEWCSNPTLNPLGVAQIVSFSLPLLWQNASMSEQASDISRSLLVAVRQLPSGSGILRAIIRHMDHIFRVDVFNAKNCGEVAEQVLANRPPRRLILPGDTGLEI